MRLLVTLIVIYFLSWLAHSQDSADVPRFEQYPSTDTFHGKPVLPILRTQSNRVFRTRIREAAKTGPNFAGRFTIGTWGCGSACLSMVTIDAKTGFVHDGPFGILGHFYFGKYYGDTPEKEAPFLEYRLNSRLLVVRGCPEDQAEKCGTYFYEWNGRTLKLLRMILVNRNSN